MTSVQITLLLLAAFWAGTSALFAGVRYVTEARDKILRGSPDGQPLPTPYRRRVLYFDWVPMRLALAAVSIVLAVIIFALPCLAGKPNMRWIAWITGAVPICGFVNFFVLGVFELRHLRQACRDEQKPAVNKGE